MMDKKGIIGDYMLENFPRIIFATVALGAAVLLLTAFAATEVDTKKAQSEVLFNRIMYSPNVFWINDSVGNVEYGHIDLDRFNSDVIAPAINYPTDRYAAAKLTILNEAGNQIKIAYLNQDKFRTWLPLEGLEGASGVAGFVKRTPITYQIGNEVRGGVLEVHILVPNA